jgi:hypothetical protein
MWKWLRDYDGIIPSFFPDYNTVPEMLFPYIGDQRGSIQDHVTVVPLVSQRSDIYDFSPRVDAQLAFS